MGDSLFAEMAEVLTHDVIVRFHIRHFGKADLVQRYTNAFRLFYQEFRAYPMHGYAVGSIINSGDEIFDVDIRIAQAIVKGQRAILAATPVEYRPLIFYCLNHDL